MKALNERFLGTTRYWWVILILGIVTIFCGFAYWFWPVQGFAVASVIFGWLLIAAGIIQLVVAAGPNNPRGWGWWIAGGIIDMFVGFMLVRSVILSEAVFPYFLAFIFIFWGLVAIITAFNGKSGRLWWLYLINGILLFIIGFFFCEAGWVQNMETVSFLTALAFIYWGFTIAIGSYDLRPAAGDNKE